MRKQRVFVDIHVLQTVPPSCINRDDTGSPKTAVYGGVTRSRVSSQAWKHAMRRWFMEKMDGMDVGQRTKRIVDKVKEEILRLSPEADAEALAVKALTGVGLKIKDAKVGTDALFFMSSGQAAALADIAVNHPELLKDKDACRKALKDHPAMDMVLFGRMVADDASLNYDAASQVAHSISTHAVHNEYDYFTAVDDRQEEDESGAAHLDTTEYNSATLYRYATVNVIELKEHLEQDAAQVVRAFVEAFARSMPTGKQNSFANGTVPNDVYIVVRPDQPVNLVPAFEKPVPVGREGGYLTASEKALAAYAKKLRVQGFTETPSLELCTGDLAAEFGMEQISFRELLDRLEGFIRQSVLNGGGE